MSYENSINSHLRTNIYRTPVEPVSKVTREAVATTGLEKSTALAELEEVSPSVGRTGDRGGAVALSSATNNPQHVSMSFADLVDIINPLQHIPVVSNIYRAITGDEISAPARVAGSTLFFGPIGTAASLANLAVEEATGRDVGDHVVSMFSDDLIDPESADSLDPGTLETAQAGAPLAGIPAAETTLSPDQPFTFSQTASAAALSPDESFTFSQTAAAAAVPEAPPPVSGAASQAIGFAGQSEPIALEALPADILAALYNGQVVRSAKPEAHASSGAAQLTDTAPRWNLWSAPDETLVSPSTAARAYGGAIGEKGAEPGSFASETSWLAASVPEILARYHSGASLKQQTGTPFVDVSQ